MCARVRCPVLVIHGDRDLIRPHAQGEALARLTGGQLVTIEGAGHGPQARDPVKTNVLLREFVDSQKPRERVWTRGRNRRRRALMVCSPIGLGHARRDVAIAKELRKLHPDLEIDWLAQHPVTRVLEAEGERIHPASALLAERVRPHRVRVGRARPALLPRLAADGRDPRRQLHGLRRRRARPGVRPLDRRRGVGRRLLPAREPGAQARGVRLADRLRRLAADGGRRRARAVPDRRLQRRDDRADRSLPARARPRAVRRPPGRRGARAVRAGPAGDPRVDRAALRVPRLRQRLRPGRVRRSREAARRTRLSAGRAGVHRDRGRLRRRRAPAAARHRVVPGCQGARSRTCG